MIFQRMLILAWGNYVKLQLIKKEIIYEQKRYITEKTLL